MSIQTQIGLVSEHNVIAQCFARGYGVLQPIGNYLPYDLILDVNSTLIKVQIKTLWKDNRGSSGSYICKSCKAGGYRSQKKYVLQYKLSDFDFGICYNRDTGDMSIVPTVVFIKVGTFTASRPENAIYLNAWHLLEEFCPHQLVV